MIPPLYEYNGVVVLTGVFINETLHLDTTIYVCYAIHLLLLIFGILCSFIMLHRLYTSVLHPNLRILLGLQVFKFLNILKFLKFKFS